MACSITARTYRCVPVSVTVSKKSHGQQGLGLRAQEVRPGGGGASGRGVDAGLVQDLPHRRRGDLHPEDEQFAVHAPVTPRRVLRGPGAAPGADRAHGARPAAARCGRDIAAWRRATRSRCQRSTVSGRTSSRILPHVAWEPVQQGGQQRPVGGGRTAAFVPVGVAAPRSGGAAPGSRRPCPGRSPEAAAATRTRSSRPGTPVAAAQPVIMPQRADLRRATSSSGPRRNRIATPTWADEIFGKHNTKRRHTRRDHRRPGCLLQAGPP